MRGLSNALFVLGLIVLVFVHLPLGALMLLAALVLAMAARAGGKSSSGEVPECTCPICGSAIVRLVDGTPGCPTCQRKW